MPSLFMSRAVARVCSPLQQYKKDSSFIRDQGKFELSYELNDQEKFELSYELNDLRSNGYIPETDCSNRVMVVVNSYREAKGALDWAFSHTIQSRDTVILLHVARKVEDINEGIDRRAYNLLQATKNMCQLGRPEVHVEIAIREGKEKGATIVEAAKQLRASLLVLGHRKQSVLWHLKIWTRKRTRSRVVDYCIQNANCMTIAVRRKNGKYGGYLITTKHHKNFWLLA